MIDTSAAVDEIEQLWSSLDRKEGDRTGFWLAIALARDGRGEPLAVELERMSEELAFVTDDGETDYSWPKLDLTRVAPAAGEGSRRAGSGVASGLRADLVSNVLFSPPGQRGAPEEPESVFATAVADELSSTERKLVQKALGNGLPEHDVYQAEPVVKLIDDLYRPLAEDLDRSRFDSLIVTELLVVAVRE